MKKNFWFKAVPSCKDSLSLFDNIAISANVFFVKRVNYKFQANSPLIPPTGEVIALKSDASEILWEFTSPAASVLSGVAVTNGVVYFHTSGQSSILYALDAMNGQPLAGVLTDGGISGP